jgi:branched-chain amino acid transport system substrate-binding protein
MKRILVLRGLVMLILAFALVACGADEPEATEVPTAPEATEEPMAEPTEAPEPEPEPIKVGGTLAITGFLAGPSEHYNIAYEIWQERINEEGGLLGRPVEFIIYDDETTPTVAQSHYARLITGDEVDLLLAPFSTLIGGPVAPIADQNDMIMWNGGFVGIEQHLNSQWLFGTYTSTEPDVTRVMFDMIDNLPEDKKPTRAGFLALQGAYTLRVINGYEGVGGAKQFALDRGMEIVMDEEYASDVADVSSLIQEAINTDVEILFAAAGPNDAGLLERTRQELGFKPMIVFYCGSQVTSLPYWKDLNPAGEYAYSTVLGWPTDNYTGAAELQEAFAERTGLEEMPTYVPIAYAILQVLEQAVEGTGSLDQEVLRDYLLTQEFDTAVGKIKYDEHGLADYNYALVQYMEGANYIVWPENRATKDAVVPMP